MQGFKMLYRTYWKWASSIGHNSYIPSALATTPRAPLLDVPTGNITLGLSSVIDGTPATPETFLFEFGSESLQVPPWGRLKFLENRSMAMKVSEEETFHRGWRDREGLEFPLRTSLGPG